MGSKAVNSVIEIIPESCLNFALNARQTEVDENDGHKVADLRLRD